MRVIYTEIKYVQSHKQAQDMIPDMISKVPHNKSVKGIIIAKRYYKCLQYFLTFKYNNTVSNTCAEI